MHIDSFPKIRLLFIVFIGAVLFWTPSVKGDSLTTSRFHIRRTSDFADHLNNDVFRNLSSAAIQALDADAGTNFDPFLPDRAISDSMNESGSASSIDLSAPRYSLPTISLKSHDLVITGSGQMTLSLRNLIVKDGTLTLQGTAGTDFIINVRNKFRLSDSAKIVLSGGLQPSDVRFDIIGSGWPVLIRQHSSLTGFIEAARRIVRITTHSQVTGGVTARKVQLRKGGNIKPPPVVSPEQPE